MSPSFFIQIVMETRGSARATSPSNVLDRILGKEDAIDVVGKLQDLVTKTKFLGRVLGLPPSTVESIHKQYSDPPERLLSVIDEFVKQVEPRPTWRTLLNALRGPLIGEYALAKTIGESLTTDVSTSAAVVPGPTGGYPFTQSNPVTTTFQPAFTMFSPQIPSSAVFPLLPSAPSINSQSLPTTGIRNVAHLY